jgi:predicted dinucleotide-binding enzyme
MDCLDHRDRRTSEGAQVKIGIIGAGRIGGNLARRWGEAGHDALLSFSRDPERLRDSARQVGATAGSVADAAAFGDVVVVAVPWDVLDEVAREAGSLWGKILIDTTNPYGPGGLVSLPTTAAEANRDRFPGVAYAKAFNTLTARFQAEAMDRPKDQRPAMFFVAEAEALSTVEQLVEATGFVPVSLGGPENAELLEPPRRDGGVYGEEYRPDDARRIAAEHYAGGDAATLAVQLKQPS